MLTLYRCEVCHQTYNDRDEALACEARRAPTDPPPRGLLLTVVDRGDTFAALCTGDLHSEKHWHRPLAFWFRDNGAGDDETPRSDVVTAEHWRGWSNTNPGAACFTRAIAKCRELAWVPSMLIGGAVVALDAPAVPSLHRCRNCPAEILEGAALCPSCDATLEAEARR